MMGRERRLKALEGVFPPPRSWEEVRLKINQRVSMMTVAELAKIRRAGTYGGSAPWRAEHYESALEEASQRVLARVAQIL